MPRAKGSVAARAGSDGAGARLRRHHELYPLHEVGGAPWLVLPECPAPRHNTARAARGVPPCGGERVPRCICPKGKKCLEAYREKERGNATSRHASRVERSIRRATYFANTLKGETPDLRGAKCKSTGGRRIVDGVISNSEGSLEAHRRMCGGCPVKDACGGWALSRENAPGEWPGMYGGMSQADRRKIGYEMKEAAR